jgi:hypothetical protein
LQYPRPIIERVIYILEEELTGDNGFIAVSREVGGGVTSTLLLLTKTSGAAFSGNGQLVCFSNPASVYGALLPLAANPP